MAMDSGRVSVHLDRAGASEPRSVRFDGGALLLKGSAGLTLVDPVGCRQVQLGIILLRDRLVNHPALYQDDGSGSRTWSISADYTIAPDPDNELLMPLWLTPTIVPRSDRRALDLEIQWSEFGPNEDGMPLVAIDLLEFSIPQSWGSVLAIDTENAMSSTTDDPESQLRVITCRDIEDVPHTSRGRHCISMRFENQVDEHDELHGRIEARFDGTLCRVTGIDTYQASGQRRRERLTRKCYTRVVLDFRLSLEALRYEALRILPTPDDEDVDERVIDSNGATVKETTSFGVIPDGWTVAAVTAALGEGEYYVKRVVENSARPGKEASTTYRFWDIAGRKYDGVYPIDFHLTITGSEVHDGAVVASGRTSFSLTVTGAYSSTETDGKVRNEWRSLHARIARTLRRREHDPRAGADLRRTIQSLLDDGHLDETAAARLRVFLPPNGPLP